MEGPNLVSVLVLRELGLFVVGISRLYKKQSQLYKYGRHSIHMAYLSPNVFMA